MGGVGGRADRDLGRRQTNCGPESGVGNAGLAGGGVVAVEARFGAGILGACRGAGALGACCGDGALGACCGAGAGGE